MDKNPFEETPRHPARMVRRMDRNLSLPSSSPLPSMNGWASHRAQKSTSPSWEAPS